MIANKHNSSEFNAQEKDLIQKWIKLKVILENFVVQLALLLHVMYWLEPIEKW